MATEIVSAIVHKLRFVIIVRDVCRLERQTRAHDLLKVGCTRNSMRVRFSRLNYCYRRVCASRHIYACILISKSSLSTPVIIKLIIAAARQYFRGCVIPNTVALGVLMSSRILPPLCYVTIGYLIQRQTQYLTDVRTKPRNINRGPLTPRTLLNWKKELKVWCRLKFLFLQRVADG